MAMTENSPEMVLLEALAPDLLRQYADFKKLKSLFFRKIAVHRAKAEIEIHVGCVKNNGGEVIGSVLLKENLGVYQGSSVCILSGHDPFYGFELYLNDKQNEVLGIMIIRLRRKSENELQWEKERLGIKHP